MFSFKRYELITLEAIRASSFVGKLIVPFFVVSLFFIALDYAVAITRSVYVGGVSNDVLTSQVVISMILYTALAIFYVVISVRTIRSLLKSQNGRTKRTMRVRNDQLICMVITSSRLLFCLELLHLD